MKRLVIALVMLAAVVVPASPVAAGGSTVFIGGGPAFPFSLCAEFGTAPNNWVLTVQLSSVTFEQYGSGDSTSVFHPAKHTGAVNDTSAIHVHSASDPAILGSLAVTYKDGGIGTVDFKETSPLKVKYHLVGPATVDLTANCSSTF